MSGLVKSSLILAFARLTNFSLLLFSPILLVRILDPATFGQYREFVVYAMLTANLAAFSINTNLLYFLPHRPDSTRQFVSNTNWLTLAMSGVACLALWLFADQIRSATSFDFVLPLAVYVLLFVNLTFLESYFIATKQPKKVFYYSTMRTTVRLVAVIGAAYYTRSVESILHALIAVEGMRILVVLFVAARLRIMALWPDRVALREQLGFIVPLGLAGSLNYLNQYAGQIIISAQLGVVALAIYAIGSYKLPVVRIVRGAISDAIFPDMVRQAASGSADPLRLWKRSNIAYTFLVLPPFLFLFWYADILIPFVFTDKYEEAVPICRILLLLLPVQCIELSSPLRAANRTGLLLVGNSIMLVTNLVCILVFFRWFRDIAIYGPAVGTVLGHVAQHLYMARKVLDHFAIKLRDLLNWRGQGIIVASLTLSAAVLFAGDYAPLPDLARVALMALPFAAVYYWQLRYHKLEEVEAVIAALRRKSRKKKSR